MVQVQREFGAVWHSPMWATDDGMMPYRVLWVYWQALQMGHATTALATAQGIGLALGDGPGAEQARSATLKAAVPLELVR